MGVFSEAELGLISAISDRVLPGDAQFPGAGVSGAASFIDNLFAGPLRPHLPPTRAWLATLESRAHASGGDFARLPADAQNSLLREFESEIAFRRLAETVHEFHWTSPAGLAEVGFVITDSPEPTPRNVAHPHD